MKQIIFITIVAGTLISSSVYAQPQKGDFFVGLSMANNSVNSIGAVYTQPFINGVVPKAGYFLTKNIAIGTNVMFGGEYVVDNIYKYNLNVTPFMRYYFRKKEEKENKKAFWFIEATAGYGLNATTDINQDVIQTGSFMMGAGAGVNYFITDNLSAETLLRYDRYSRSSQSQSSVGHLSAEVGIQYFFRKQSKKQVKTGF